MVKLNRFTMPVFAGNAAQTQTSVFGTMKTSPQYTTDVAASIGTTAYGNGWADAIEIGYAPYMEDMNTLQRAITYQISYNQQQGIPEWDSSTEYYIGSLAKLNTANGSQVYSSLIDNNVGNLVSDATKWKLVFDTENSYVTTNTIQTITGAKTFTAKLSTAPIELYPTSGSDKPYIDFHYDSSSSDYTSRIIENSSGNLTISATSLQAPIPSDTTSTSSQKVATTGWVNTSGNNVVHLNSDETVTGLKTIRRSALQVTMLDLVNGSITNGVAPSENAHTRIYFSDKNAHATACIYNSFDSNGDNGLYLQALLSETITQGTNRSLAHIGIKYPASGNPCGVAPHSDTNGSILTTYTKSKSANGYFRLGNGMIVQWGTSSTSNSSGVFTLPTAFTSTNYAVVMNHVLANVPPSQGSNANVVGWGVVQSRTTTNFTAFLCNYENSYWWRDAAKTVTWIAIGY